MQSTPAPLLPPPAAHRLPADTLDRSGLAHWQFPAALTARQRDAARNTIAAAHGRALHRRFSGACLTGFGDLA